MSLLIKNANVITDLDIKESFNILVSDGKIVYIGPEEREADDCIDAEGLYASPGFIDIHTHGAGGADYMDATLETYQTAAKAHAYHGVTTVLPTTLSATKEELLDTFSVYEIIRKEGSGGADMPGLHLEGPYFAPSQMGAQDPEYVRDPEPEEYDEILEKGKDYILRWSIAPELKGAMEFGDHVMKYGILPSVAHSDATYDQTKEAFFHGYRLITHLYCCTSNVTSLSYSKRKGEDFSFDDRTLGIDEAAYVLDDMYVECIGDGIHVLPDMLYTTYKIKGADRMILCTDSMRAAGTTVERSILGSEKKGRAVYFEDGVAKILGTKIVAASIATGERLLQTAVNKAKIPLVDAVKMLSKTPATLMKLNDRGILQCGKRADIVLFDKEMNLKTVLVGGTVMRNDL
jgi:N-acetylglucosamine-6-phosphate deacetylase